MGLNDVLYGTVHSNLLATNPLPYVNKIYSILVQEERIKTITPSRKGSKEIIGMVVQTGVRFKERGEAKNKSMACSHCNRTRHEEAGYFKIVGYPDWWSERPTSIKKSRGRGKGQQRAGNNTGREQMVHANAAQTVGAGVGASIGTNFIAENSGLTCLSDEQWQILMEVLKNSKSSTSERIIGYNKFDTWIIDTRASNHMTGSLMKFL